MNPERGQRGFFQHQTQRANVNLPKCNHEPKILFALTSHDRKGDTGQATGFYLPEAAHPWAVLKAVGFDVDFTSPKGGKPPMDGVDLDDATNRSAVPIPLDEPHAGRLERRRDVVQVR